jgi:FtsH-binding integral membrane protein
MSYPMEYDFQARSIAAEAAATERATFIRRTYAHLAGAILAFAALTTVLLQIPGIEQVALAMVSSRMSWLVVFGAFFAVSWVAERWASSDTSIGMQYLGLSLYVVAQAVIFLPLLYIASTFYPDAIPTAGLLTLACFGGLTLTVLLTRSDFSFLRTYLIVGGWLAMGLIVAGLVFNFSLGLIFLWAMVALMCGYIVYHTSNVLHHYRTDQHVAASLALFAAVATLFWYILQIVMSRRN